MNKVAETKNYFSSSIYVCCYLIQIVVISKQTLTFNALTMETLTLCSSILLHFLWKLNWSNVLGKLGRLCSICVCFCFNPNRGQQQHGGLSLLLQDKCYTFVTVDRVTRGFNDCYTFVAPRGHGRGNTNTMIISCLWNASRNVEHVIVPVVV